MAAELPTSGQVGRFSSRNDNPLRLTITGTSFGVTRADEDDARAAAEDVLLNQARAVRATYANRLDPERVLDDARTVEREGDQPVSGEPSRAARLALRGALHDSNTHLPLATIYSE